MLYITRYIIILIFILFFGIISFIGVLFRPFHPNNAFFYVSILGKVIKKVLNYQLKVTGIENLNLKKPFIIISNHQSALDVSVCSTFACNRTICIGKKSLIYIPFWGLFFILSGNILLDRKNRKKAIASLDKLINKINKQKVAVWIMPEGTRTKQKGLAPFKKGAFYTAIKGKFPIVPVAISSYHKGLNFKRLKSGKVYASVLNPIYTDSLKIENAKDLAFKCHSLINEEIKRLDDKLSYKQEYIS